MGIIWDHLKQKTHEIRYFLLDRSKKIGAEKIYTQRRFYHHLCHMLQKQRNKPESFLDWDKQRIQQMKIWLMKQGLPLTESYKKTEWWKRNCTGKNIVVCRASDRLSGSFKRDRRK